MEINERAEEALETLWIAIKEDAKDGLNVIDLDSKAIKDLLKHNIVSQSGDIIKLTESGLPKAENIVRRHRLAERLLTDVLGTSEDGAVMHEKACKFEHLLDHGLDDSICTLLGHPKICPHGKLIPPGKCCTEQDTRVTKVISPLSQLAPGQRGRVAYIYAPQTGKLQKMMAMGILPGAPITLLQGFASCVFASGETQFAIDKEIADAIYIRLIKETAPRTIRKPADKHQKNGPKGRQRFRLFR
jgi:DtxR family Mn-dependent transcriptional regulator